MFFCETQQEFEKALGVSAAASLSFGIVGGGNANAAFAEQYALKNTSGKGNRGGSTAMGSEA
jgi:hypothetical protein